jgi:hypothetical protein
MLNKLNARKKSFPLFSKKSSRCPWVTKGIYSTERTREGLKSARARGRVGGRPYKMTATKLRYAMASMGHPETKIGPLCKELGITRQTLYRHLCPKGTLRPDGEKLLKTV